MKHKILLMALMAAMSGCIDSGNDDTTDSGSGGDGGGGPATVERISFSGLVADGYLAGATVCLDINENKVCDDGEPSTASGTGGAFEIDDATQAQRDTYPLLVEVVVGTTIDEDNEGVALTKPLTLSAPVGYSFVSPLSTMVQNEVEDGATSAVAEQAVQEKLGTSLSLDEDYIAAQESGDFTAAEQAEFEQLHQVAQVTARVISDNLVKLEDAAQADNIPLDELISAIVDEVFEALADITGTVEEIADSGETFDPDEVAEDVDEELVDLNADNIGDVVEQKQAEEEATAANLASVMLGDGLAWFWAEMEDGSLKAEYGIIKTNAQNEFIENPYEWDGSAFVVDTTSDPDSGHIFNATTGWEAISNLDEPSSVVANNDGTIDLVKGTGDASFSDRLKGEEVDLEGINLRTVMASVDDGDGLWPSYLPADAEFPAGAKGYILSDNGSDTPYIIETWTDCDVQYQLNGSCNSTNLRNATVAGSFENATTLASIVSSSAHTLTDDFETDSQAIVSVEIGYNESDNSQLWAELLANNSVNYYHVSYNSTGSITLIGSSTWSELTAGGDVLYVLDNLFDTVNRNSFEDTDDVLSVIDGFVRRGFKNGGENNDSSSIGLLNKAAADYVVSQFSLDNYTAPDDGATTTSGDVCTTGNTNWDGQLITIPTSWNTIAEFSSAVASCLDGSYVFMQDDVSGSVSTGVNSDVIISYLPNGYGLSQSDTIALKNYWFEWEVETSGFSSGDLKMYYSNDNGDETVTAVVMSFDGTAIESKAFLENDAVTANSGQIGHISSVSATMSDVDDGGVAGIVASFDTGTLPGTYIWGTPDGDSTFVFNADGTGTVNWPAEDGDTSAPNGYNDVLEWSLNADGRLLVALWGTVNNDGVTKGELVVERYTITAGTQSSGSVTLEAINSDGYFETLIGDDGVTEATHSWTKQ